MHNCSKIKGLDSGKLRHCQTYMRHFSHRRNKPHAYHKTHLHTMKVVTILIPSFHGLRQERVSYKLGPRRKKKTETPVFLESHFAKASSTKNWRLRSVVDSCWRVKCIFNGFEFFKMHCNVSQWFVTYFDLSHECVMNFVKWWRMINTLAMLPSFFFFLRDDKKRQRKVNAGHVVTPTCLFYNAL